MEDVPLLIIDEADELTEEVGDMLLQLPGRGTCAQPRLGDLGVRDRPRWPVVILPSNDIRHGLSPPLRSRCLYSWLAPPREEVRILLAHVPVASREVLAGVTKLITCVRRDMPAVRDKSGRRESIDLLEAQAETGAPALTATVIDTYLRFLGKRQKDPLSLRQGLARLEFAVHAPGEEIDEGVAWACRAQGATTLNVSDASHYVIAAVGVS